MKKVGWLVCAVWAMAVILAPQIWADQFSIPSEEDAWRPGVDFMLDYGSRYMYRGEVWNPDHVLQGDLCLSLQGFYAGIWTCFDFTDANGYNNEPEEWNYYLGYEYKFQDVPVVNSITLGVGWIYFDYPRAAECDTQEAYLTMSLEDTVLTPSLTVNCDYEHNTWWVQVGVRHEMPLEQISEKLCLLTGFDLYWGNTRWNARYNDAEWRETYQSEPAYKDTYKNAISTGVLSAELNYKINDHFSFGPYLIAAWVLDHDIREMAKASQYNHAFNFVWGARLAMVF